jgi:uncharacterized membrane protein (UPF0127 family)
MTHAHDAGRAGPLRPAFLAPVDDAPFTLINARTRGRLAARVTLAVDSAMRRKGLLGRQSLGADDALVLAPCWAVHTCFMQFAIDIAFISDDGRVVDVRHDVRPWHFAIEPRACCVVELAAGTLERTRTRIGDILVASRR